MSIPLTSWDIGLDAWIVQDGNYPDFKAGQLAEFAVEFWLPHQAASLATDRAVAAARNRDCLYDVVAEVVLRNDAITVLDIGILVFQESQPSQQQLLRQGDRLAFQLGLGVDPFFYFEALAKSACVPPLIYSWKVRSILRQTGPMMESVAGGGHKVFIRDSERLGYEEIAETDAWSDDGGCAEYLLRCELLPIPPKHQSATANY